MRTLVHAAVLGGLALVAAGRCHAQRGGGDWMTIGNDAQRSSWLRGDPKISFDTMLKPGFQLVWKVKLKNEARQLNSLTPPALLDFYIGYRGFRTLGFFGGSDVIVTLDTDLARVEWEKPLASGPRASSTVPCPGGMTSSVTRPTFAGYPAAGGGRGFGRGGPAKSGVGEPLEGAVTLRDRPPQFTPPPAAAAAAPRRTAPVPNPFARTPQYLHAVTADGKFHAFYASNGEEPNPPLDFLPPNAHAVGLIVFDSTAYVATINGCGGVENGVWALHLPSKKVTQWKSAGTPVGKTGFAVAPDGTLYVATKGGELVALEPGTLTVKTSHKAGTDFTSAPVIFEYKGKDMLAVANSAGKLELFDTAALGQPLAATTAFSGADFSIGALASWQDAAGTRWLLAPAPAAIAAFKVVDENGVTVLQRGWVSREMVSPIPPAIVNGVVFAVSSDRRASKAVLYALDALSGKELWNSGNTSTSFVSTGGLAAGGGRVYVGAHDGTQYAFGFPMEH